jgi:L-lysine exporter family protein LysE/ArgO
MAFIHGFILALGLILPLGVQNLFVLQQGMAQPRFWRTVPAVATASLCDTLLIGGAVSGISLLLMGYASLRLFLLLAGSLFLFYMGWKNWHSPAAELKAAGAVQLPARRQVMFAMSVSLLNPYAFSDIIGVIGTSSLQYEGEAKLAFTVAAVLVSWFWFTGLSLLGHMFQHLPAWLQQPRLIQRLSAIFIWGSALYLLWQGIG